MLLSGALLLALALSPQGSGKLKPGLELRLKADNVVAGVPQDFVFELVNNTDHDILLPTPELMCQGSRDGEIHLVLSSPLEATSRNMKPKGGCAKDYVGHPAVTDLIKTWRTLHAGEVLSLQSTGHAMLMYDDLIPGKYAFSATYTPPNLTSLDQGTLRAMTIDFPSRPLTSNRLTYTSTNK